MAAQDEELDVIIVGAGFTGLAAAAELSKLGASFVVLDAYTDHLGGRAYSYDAPVPSGSPLRFDHGAQYVGDAQNAIMDVVREKLPAGSLVNGANLRLSHPYEVMVLAQKRYCFRSDQVLFGIPGVPPQLSAADAFGMIGMLAEMTLIEWSIDVVSPWQGDRALLALDQIDCWSYLESKWWLTAAVRDLMRISIEALLSVEPKQISPYYLLWYTACNDGFLNEINDDAGGPQQYWLRRGTDEIADAIAEPFRDSVRQGVRVSEIEHGEGGVVVRTSTGEELRAKRVLVAVSPSTAGRIRYLPELDAAHEELMAQPMGKTIKCQLYYRTPWWHDSKGLDYDGYVGGANYPVLWVMDNSPPDAAELGSYVLMTFTVGDQADQLGPNPSDEAITAWVTSALAKLFDDDRALPGQGELLKVVTHRWLPSDPFVGGGPNTIFSPGKLTSEVGRALDQHVGDRVFFASAENAKRLAPRSSSSRWSIFAEENIPAYDAQSRLLATSKPPFYSKYSDRRADLGYMSGAIESGRYVAHEIAASLGREHALPAPAERLEPAELPTPAGEGLPSVADILAAVRERLEGLADEELGELDREARGRGAVFGGWLRELLVDVLHEQGHVEDPGDERSVLHALRDLAVGLAPHLGLASPTEALAARAPEPAVAEHLAAIDARVRRSS